MVGVFSGDKQLAEGASYSIESAEESAARAALTTRYTEEVGGFQLPTQWGSYSVGDVRRYIFVSVCVCEWMDWCRCEYFSFSFHFFHLLLALFVLSLMCCFVCAFRLIWYIFKPIPGPITEKPISDFFYLFRYDLISTFF